MANPGDYVDLTTNKKEYKGLIIKHPDLLGKDITVLKLDSGYNIGIKNSEIKEIKLIRSYRPPKKLEGELPIIKGLPTVSILSFGGTISSKVDYATGGVYADYTAKDFVELMPELRNIANLRAKKVMAVMSEDMNPNHWKEMAKAVAEEIKSGVDGVVVTQGTDTLHFSSSAISYMLPTTPVPIIFTASQRSIDRGSSDGFMNLFCAVTAAAKIPAAEVFVCLHKTSDDTNCSLITGTKVRKMHSSRRDAFQPMSGTAFAEITSKGKITLLKKEFQKRGSPLVEEISNEEKVALHYVYPGQDPKMLDFYLDNDYKGIVFAGTGLGHIPMNEKGYSFENFLKKAKEKGIIMVMTTQTLYGRVHPFVYSPLRVLSMEYEIIYAGDLLPETAYVKLSHILSKEQDKQKIKKLILTPKYGDITDRTLYGEF